MEGLDADMDIEQIEVKIARMKREIARKQRKLLKWEKAALVMKNVTRSQDISVTPVPAEERTGTAVMLENKTDPTSVDAPLNDDGDRDQDCPLTHGENPSCQMPGKTVDCSDTDSSGSQSKKTPPADASPQLPTEDSLSKEDAQTTENAAMLALRRSSRRSRSSYIFRSDEFITQRKIGSQVSLESESNQPGLASEQATCRFVFPEPPQFVAKLPIIEFFLPDDEFADCKIRLRRKTSLRSGARAASDQCVDGRSQIEKSSSNSEDTITEKLEEPSLSKFESVFSLDTLTRESIKLVHCGKLQLATRRVCAIAAVQNSKISVWAEQNDGWTLLFKVPLELQCNIFNKFSGYHLPDSMGLALVTDSKNKRAVWCYDLLPPVRKRCLESVSSRKLQSCAILSCVVGEKLVYAEVGSNGTKLKTYQLNVHKGMQLGHMSNINDALSSLQPIMELKDAVIGFSTTHLYIWNHETGELRKQMQVPGNPPFHKCTFAQEESGLLVLGVVTGARNPRHHIVVANPAVHKSLVLGEYKDVVELPNQCLQSTTRVGKHLVACGGDNVGRVAIWNFFSGNLAAFLNDARVTAVCCFPAECSQDFLVATGTRQGIVILYKLPFSYV